MGDILRTSGEKLGTRKGCRSETQSLPGLGFHASPCRFHFETVSIYGNFIFVAPSVLHRISFCYDNIPFWVFFFLFMEKEPTFRCLELLSKIALKYYCCSRLRLSSFCSAGRGGLKSQGGVERGAGRLWSGQPSLCVERMWRILHRIWERNTLLGNFHSALCLMVCFWSVPWGWFIYKTYCFCQVCATGLSGVSGMKNAN